MSFKNKVAIITGGGSGIGLETARALVGHGAKVVLNGRNAEKLSEAAQDIDPDGHATAIVAGDIGEVATGENLVAAAQEKFGGVDILINNAGIFSPKPFLDHTEEDFDAYARVILKGSFFAAQAAVRAMRVRGGGVIVNTGSMWATQAIGATPSSAYSAAKAGVHALTRNLAIELADDRIRVNTVAPAVVETPVYDTFMSADEVRDVLPTFAGLHPLGRNGQPTDLVSAILFLASEEASWITGVILPVDGGVTAGRQAA
ncbi:MAG: glucose 1-dehydrogenase [Proteobacteria bacterium]|nr:glucose 1-dehydrogenase [Pseudomonadota bacterium]MDA1023230.1 glucose 1-dehydrogenase [Pseudomonadota bacterium]